MGWASLYLACSSLFNFVGERKRNPLNTLMYLGDFCLSPSHSMRFPVTAIIKSAIFFGIIFLCVLFKSFIKKWKKVLRHSVWRDWCRVLESASYRGFWGFLSIWSGAWLKNFFDFFSENLPRHSEFVQSTYNGVVEYTAKNRSISTFIFYFFNKKTAA